MGLYEFIDFVRNDERRPKPPAIGWGIPGLPWSECACDSCHTIKHLTRPELAFILMSLREDDPETLATMLAAIRAVRAELWPV